MRRPLPILVAIALCTAPFGAAACGSDEEDGSSTQGTATRAQQGQPTTPAAPANAGCRKVRAPEPRPAEEVPKPRGRLDPGKTYTAEIATNCGTFTIALDVRRSPKTANSFVHLARRGFYDGLAFHRIVPGFVIQGGDPEGTGNGGPGYSVVEPPPQGIQYEQGVVAMAKTEIEEPGTSGSQFFVVTAPTSDLPPDYAVLGRVTAGFPVVQRIGVVPVDPATDQPVEPVVIRKVTIRER